MQLATDAETPSVALAAISAAGLFRLDVRVDSGRDQLIGTASPVLVDDRGPFAVVPHPGHQVPQPGAAYSRKVIPGMAKIMKVQAFGAGCADRMRPRGQPLPRQDRHQPAWRWTERQTKTFSCRLSCASRPAAG